MGVPGLRDYLATAHAEAVLDRMPGGWCDHLYVDMNSLVHDAVRHAKSEKAALQSITNALTTLVTQHRPYRSLTLALDGPAPLAKLNEQRQRRLKRHKPRGKGLSSSIVTVGTPFMRDLNALLYSWAARSTWLPLMIVVDPSLNAGEGELKLFSHLTAAAHRSRAVLEEHSHLVVGGDADLMLLALTCPARHVVVRAPPTGRGGRHVYFSCELFRRRLAHLAPVPSSSSPPPPPSATPPPSPEQSGPRAAALDFVLLALLSGDDYLPRLRGYSLQRAVDAYHEIACRRLVVCSDLVPCSDHATSGSEASTSTMLSTSGSEASTSTTLSIDVRALGQLLVALVDGELRTRRATATASCATATVSRASTIGGMGEARPAAEVETAAGQYLEGLLWTLTMYSEAHCPDYHWVLDEERGLAPTVDELAELFSDERACARLDASVACPRSARAPPSAAEVPLLVLPAAGSQLALPPVRPLFEPKSSLYPAACTLSSSR